jgi:hypothetical protein
MSAAAGNNVGNAADHAHATGDGTRAALPAMPAPKRGMTRRIAVTRRAPFLPDHHGHARHSLKGEE